MGVSTVASKDTSKLFCPDLKIEKREAWKDKKYPQVLLQTLLPDSNKVKASLRLTRP